MANKVYEASTLQSAAEERAMHYKSLKEQFERLKKEFSSIVGDSEFQGHGAEAIKGFYQAQTEVVDAWIQLIDMNTAFLKGIPGDAEDANLAGSTVVQVPFLEENVARSIRMSQDMVDEQQDALQRIFNDVSDLISLNVFSKGPFEDLMHRAEKKRDETVDKVIELDQKLTQEYMMSQNQESLIYALFAQLMEATRQGESISPIHFNSQAYYAGEVHKAKSEVEQMTSEYLTFKEDQIQARIAAKEIEEMENRPWYEKTWDTVCTFTGEVTGYYDSKRAIEGVDPVTGRKLSDAERVAAGAMAAAGFIPIVGWAGRAVKGGSAIYKTAKGVDAAADAMRVMRTPKGLTALQKTEYGIYGLVSANGFSEYFTGKDMFGNKLTDEQRQQSMFNAFAILGVGGAGYAIDKMNVSKMIQNKFPYSTQYAKMKVAKAQELFKAIGKNVGNARLPVGFKVESLSTATGQTLKTITVDTKTAKELLQQALMVKGRGTAADNLLGKVDFSKLDDTGLKKLIEQINKSNLSPEEKVIANINLYKSAVAAGVKSDVQVLSSTDIIDNTTGNIKWPPAEGYVVDGNGIAAKNEIIPKIGHTIDRYGSPYGTYTSPVLNGNAYTFEQRALPYIENSYAYHKYEVVRDFDELKDVIENWSDDLLREEFFMDAKAYRYDVESFKTFAGEIAPAFGAKGGGIQWNLPISVEYLVDFGFLKEIK